MAAYPQAARRLLSTASVAVLVTYKAIEISRNAYRLAIGIGVGARRRHTQLCAGRIKPVESGAGGRRIAEEARRRREADNRRGAPIANSNCRVIVVLFGGEGASRHKRIGVGLTRRSSLSSSANESARIGNRAAAPVSRRLFHRTRLRNKALRWRLRNQGNARRHVDAWRLRRRDSLISA